MATKYKIALRRANLKDAIRHSWETELPYLIFIFIALSITSLNTNLITPKSSTSPSSWP